MRPITDALKLRVAELEAEKRRMLDAYTNRGVSEGTDPMALLDRYREALERIRREGACETLYEGTTCRDTHPDQTSEWCSHCIASAALNPK